MSSQPLELDRAYRLAADQLPANQPLPLIVALPFIMGLSAALWLMIGRLAKALLGL